MWSIPESMCSLRLRPRVSELPHDLSRVLVERNQETPFPLFDHPFTQDLGGEDGFPRARNTHNHGGRPVKQSAAHQIVQSLNPDDGALGRRRRLIQIAVDGGLNAAIYL